MSGHCCIKYRERYLRYKWQQLTPSKISNYAPLMEHSTDEVQKQTTKQHHRCSNKTTIRQEGLQDKAVEKKRCVCGMYRPDAGYLCEREGVFMEQNFLRMKRERVLSPGKRSCIQSSTSIALAPRWSPSMHSWCHVLDPERPVCFFCSKMSVVCIQKVTQMETLT